MRALIPCMFAISLAYSAEPASLHVDVIDGRRLSFTLVNHYSKPVTRFKVEAGTGEPLSCSVTAEVKRPSDLHLTATCGLQMDTSTGPVFVTNWKTRIVFVEYADGMRWTPKD